MGTAFTQRGAPRTPHPPVLVGKREGMLARASIRSLEGIGSLGSGRPAGGQPQGQGDASLGHVPGSHVPPVILGDAPHHGET